MKLYLFQRTWFSFLQAVRTWAHPAFGGVIIESRPQEPDDVELEDDDEPTEIMHPPGQQPQPTGRSLVLSQDLWCYINYSGVDGKAWELPLPKGTQFQMTAERWPEWAVAHRCDRDKDN